jgi:hypothetical protein
VTRRNIRELNGVEMSARRRVRMTTKKKERGKSGRKKAEVEALIRIAVHMTMTKFYIKQKTGPQSKETACCNKTKKKLLALKSNIVFIRFYVTWV